MPAATTKSGRSRRSGFESGGALRRRTVQDHAGQRQGAAVNTLRRDLGAPRPYIAGLEQALGAAVTGRRAEFHRFGQLGVGQPAVALQQPENAAVDAIEVRTAGRRR